ncbi:hypothetical protein R50073_45780 [Maricurvus nonylphenolicus]|uniref:DUF6985 domain-containing protein n=1 Tax=Maricurvus nonylphenolicus TaxID=1008307 RepID=UPI0036F2C4BA
MELIRNLQEGEFGLEGEAYFQHFSTYIKVYADEEANEAYIKICAEYMNSLDANIIEALCKASIRYCNDFLKMTGQPERGFAQLGDVLKLIQPNSLIVPDPENGNEPVVHLELECEWEVEHGMEWLVRSGEVLYVGGFNDVNEWGNYSEKASYNYA